MKRASTSTPVTETEQEKRAKKARKCWKITAGSLKNLKLVTEELEITPDQLQVEVAAVGLNFADVCACMGLYSATPAGQFIPGLEFSGRVSYAPVGSKFRIGDRVMGLTRFGGYASSINVRDRDVRLLRSDWSFSEGASFLAQSLTAWHGLVNLAYLQRTPKPMVVLIHSAAGGVGLLALQICRHFGASVIATVGTQSKKDLLVRDYGLTKESVIVRSSGPAFTADLATALAAVSADTLDIVFDAILGDFFAPAYEKLGRGGRHIVFGAADYITSTDKPSWLHMGWRYMKRPKIDPLQMITDNKSVMGFNLIWMWDQTDTFESMLTAMSAMNWQPPHVGATFPFDDCPSALRLLQSGQSTGKVVLEL